jgi:hypothetical protein
MSNLYNRNKAQSMILNTRKAAAARAASLAGFPFWTVIMAAM